MKSSLVMPLSFLFDCGEITMPYWVICTLWAFMRLYLNPANKVDKADVVEEKNRN